MQPRWTALGGAIALLFGLALGLLGAPWDIVAPFTIFGIVFVALSGLVWLRRRTGA